MKNVSVIVGGLVLAMVGGLLGIVVILGGATQATLSCPPGGNMLSADGAPGSAVTGAIPSSVGIWKGEQLVNAAAVVNAGAEVGISRRGQTIAVMTAMGESGLKVLEYGDAAGPDSRGLFQQRANGAWGSLADRMDPRISSINFFRALMRVAGWESMAPTLAAHKTQRNADPYHYEKYWDDAVDVVAALLPAQVPAVNVAPGAPGDVAGGSAGASGAGEDPYSLGQVQPQLRALVNVLAPMFAIKTVGGYRPSARDPEGHPAGLAADFMVPMTAAGKQQGERLAAYARQNAAQLSVDYILWDQAIWSSARADEGWRPMDDRGSPTQNHEDHVHINVVPGGRVDAAGLPTAQVSAPGRSGIGAVAFAAFCAKQNAMNGGLSGMASGLIVYPVDDKDSDRKNFGNTGSLWASTHTGTDFSVPCGTPVKAVHAGTVSVDSIRWAGPNFVKISSGGSGSSSLTTWYAHMQSITVRAGDVVAAGQVIGQVGSLGNTTGCHLHLEVREKGENSDPVDPTVWLAEHVGTYVGWGPGLRIATWNVLGHSHTSPGGNATSYGDSGRRIERALDRINAAGLEIVGLQEFQPIQHERFLGAAAGTWSTFPAPDTGLDNVVAWRTDRWDAVRTRTIPIPYFGGAPKRMPYVLLRSLQTGEQVWVGSFHNPADVGGNQVKHRLEAVRREAALATRLYATGVPVIFTGDMNAREGYYCRTVKNSPLRSAAGGSVSPCRTEPNPGIDWVMGAGVGWSSYLDDWSVKDDKISDHPLVSATGLLATTPRTPPEPTRVNQDDQEVDRRAKAPGTTREGGPR